MPLRGRKRRNRKSSTPVKRKKIMVVVNSVETEAGTPSEVQAPSCEPISLNYLYQPNTCLNVMPLNGSNIVQLVTSSDCSQVSSTNRGSIILSTSSIVTTSGATSCPTLPAISGIASSSDSTPDDLSSLTPSCSSEVPNSTVDVNRITDVALVDTSEPVCSSVADISSEPSSSSVSYSSSSCQEVTSEIGDNNSSSVTTTVSSVEAQLPVPCTSDSSGVDSTAKTEERSGDECPVCLQQCVHPAKLPCKHVFCYLCLKGIARLRLPCPLCRAPIPFHFADQPELVASRESPSSASGGEPQEKFCWFYQGRHGGWWQFEQRMSDEIEENRESGTSQFEIMICGSLYVIDTMSCVQFPKNCPTRVRKLRRELPSRINKKGVAGIYGNPGKSTGRY